MGVRKKNAVSDQEKLAYAQQIISAYESGAMRSGSQKGVIATLLGPLDAMDRITKSSKDTIDRKPSDYTNEPDENDQMSLREFMDEKTGPESWLAECIACDFRPLAEWELAPLAFADPLTQLMNQINAALDQLEAALDIQAPLESLCLLLNGLQRMCPQDIVVALMGLKLLFRLRAAKLFQLRLDWTAVLGPLLSVVFDAVANLLDWIDTIIIGVLDCVIGAVRTAGLLQQSAGRFVGAAAGYAETLASVPGQYAENAVEAHAGEDDAHDPFRFNGAGLEVEANRSEFIDAGRGDFDFQPDSARDILLPEGEIALSSDDFFAGGFVTTGVTLEELRLDQALRTPGWADASWADHLLVSLSEARTEVKDLLAKFLLATRSLRELVGTGITAQIEGTQALLYLISMFKLLAVVAEVLKALPDIGDYCDQFEENPDLFQGALEKRFPEYRFNTQRSARSGGGPGATIVVEHASRKIAAITSCSSQQTHAEKQEVRRWIQNLTQLGLIQ